jgi:hypothetical protein
LKIVMKTVSRGIDFRRNDWEQKNCANCHVLSDLHRANDVTHRLLLIYLSLLVQMPVG